MGAGGAGGGSAMGCGGARVAGEVVGEGGGAASGSVTTRANDGPRSSAGRSGAGASLGFQRGTGGAGAGTALRGWLSVGGARAGRSGPEIVRDGGRLVSGTCCASGLHRFSGFGVTDSEGLRASKGQFGLSVRPKRGRGSGPCRAPVPWPELGRPRSHTVCRDRRHGRLKGKSRSCLGRGLGQRACPGLEPRRSWRQGGRRCGLVRQKLGAWPDAGPARTTCRQMRATIRCPGGRRSRYSSSVPNSSVERSE